MGASAGAGVMICEIVFRFALVEAAVPATPGDFEKRISSAWPRQISVERAPGSFRILGLADSFGRAGVETNYHYVLEDLLKRDNPRVELLNLSAGAYEPHDELLLLQRFGAKYRPDIVVHGFFIGNDFMLPEGELVDFRGIVLRRKRGPASWLPHNFLSVKWLYRFAMFLRHREGRRPDATPEDAIGGRSGTLISESAFLSIARDRMGIARRDLLAPFSRTLVLDVLDEIHETVREMGAKHIIVFHPDQFQVEGDLRRKVAAAFGLDLDRDYDMEAPQRVLREYCASRNIPCLDLLPLLEEKPSEGGYFEFRSTHYNTEGNRLAANAIYEFLNEKALMKGSR